MEYPSCQHIEQYLVPGKRCHLVGIGGVSMRPLGLVLRRMGMEISGSDMNASVSTDELILASTRRADATPLRRPTSTRSGNCSATWPAKSAPPA